MSLTDLVIAAELLAASTLMGGFLAASYEMYEEGYYPTWKCGVKHGWFLASKVDLRDLYKLLTCDPVHEAQWLLEVNEKYKPIAQRFFSSEECLYTGAWE